MAQHFHFECNGDPWLLNGHLIEMKGLDGATCEMIADLHRLKVSLISDMAKLKPTNDTKLHELGDRIATVEYEMQDAWGFVRDKNWHKHWELPHCTCPKVTNKMAHPQHGFTSDDCPVHGEL